MADIQDWVSPTGSPTHYQRPFDHLEKYEYYMSTMNPTISQRAVVVGVSLSSSSPFSSLSLKAAWRSLRYAHPILGCKIIPTGFDFNVKSSTEIDEWVESTVKTIHPQESKEGEGEGGQGQESQKSIKLLSSNPPHPETAELYYSPSTNELFIQIRHEIIDGIGSLMLLNNFLTSLFSPPTQSSTRTDSPSLLSPSTFKITGTKPASPEIVQKNASLVQAYFASPPISLSSNPSPTLPYESHRYDYTFTSSQSSLLLKTCKSHEITITHAVTASTAFSILKLTNQTSGVFSTTLPISLRDTLPAPYNTPVYAALFCITTPLPVMPITPETTLISLSKDVKREFDDWKNDKDNIRYHEPQLQMFEEAVKAGLSPSNSAGKATVVVSSLGIVEKYLTVASNHWGEDSNVQGGGGGESGGRVKDFWMGQVQGNTKIIVFLYTFAGKIRLAACYNRRFHEDKDVQELIRVIVETLYEGLGIDGNTP
ncbi:hypothetical protein TWF569_008062 [Orbilia oligospora]|uniref:Alcohol acetyltransferase n=2 Tax=Orbilia oligospora TaxID=2813651 RepID=A0A7C8J5Y4_ORBOL|nr:hypothetical protein TWF102_001088 [Orbilia oligospora]KAF3092218.1 hypothetical protein TWF706_009063 [Orbilia oligospora]KAF3136274.1 hypothetical protein TWF594_007915 [Orbilia oligospora]KAF3141178.1 hypothetical protein TWF569_008062 [Orbilia oligospora]